MRRYWSVVAASLLMARLASAAPSLAELTPSDAGVSISIEGLASAIDEFRAGPHFARLRDFPPLAEWSGKNRAAIEHFIAEAGRQIGVEPQAVWQDVMGHRLMLAAWPPEQPGKEHGPGLLLVEASNQATLEQVIAGVHDAQQRAGEVLHNEERTHAGLAYQARTLRRRGGEATLFLASSGGIGIVASHERQMKQVLELLTQQAGAAKSLASLPAYQAAHAHADPQAPLFAFINARVWDATIAAAPADGKRSARQSLLRKGWLAIRCCWLSLRVCPQLEFEARVEFESLDEPQPLRNWIETVARPTGALEWIPADCLAAVAGSFDVQAMMDQIQPPPAEQQADEPSETSDESSKPPGKSNRTLKVLVGLLDQAFDGIGPSGGGYAVAAEAAEHELALDLVAGVQTGRRQAADATAASPARRLESLRSLLLVAVSLVNLSQEPATAEVAAVRNQAVDLFTVKGLENLPEGWLPSFGFAGETLLAGTSPDAVARAACLDQEQSLGASPRLADLLGSSSPRPDQLFYVDMAAMRTWLSRHSEAVLALGAGQDSTARQRGLDQLLAALRLADALAICLDAEPTGIQLRAVLHIDQPAAR